VFKTHTTTLPICRRRWGAGQGGLVIKLNIRGTSLVFVSSHLAAHMQYVEHRNAHFREIVHETRKQVSCWRASPAVTTNTTTVTTYTTITTTASATTTTTNTTTVTTAHNDDGFLHHYF
jgi:hypothetical protein